MKITVAKKIIKVVSILIVCGAIACTRDTSLLPKTLPFQVSYNKGSLPDVMPVPTYNPLTVQGVALGRRLFYDKILSANNTQACASCHKQENAFADGHTKFSIGIDGIIGDRNAMPLFNLAWAKTYFWDGRAKTLEEQALQPIENEIEMHAKLDDVLAKLNADTQYPQLFLNAFGSKLITRQNLAKAIAQFERTIISSNSYYDKWLKGEVQLSSTDSFGKILFDDQFKGDCTHCHTLGSTFSDFDFKNNGLDLVAVDSGKYKQTLLSDDIGKFKTPTLRNIALTSPYMHDGRFETLEGVLQHYNIGFHNPPNLDVNMEKGIKGRLTIPETKAIISFLKTLTDSSLLTNSAYSQP
jgi:cytochrome c peroxidase